MVVPDSYGLPGRTKQNKLIKFLVCANVGVLVTLDILSQACEKHINSIFCLAISVLEYYIANYVMSCFSV